MDKLLNRLMISKESVFRISKLAKLHLTSEELEVYARQLSAILDYFQQTSEVDTQGVKPLGTPIDVHFHEREDQVEKFPGGIEGILGNAPDRVGNLFRVPPVV